MIDLLSLRQNPEPVTAALLRRGVAREDIEAVIALDVEHRRLLQNSESLRAKVKELSRGVGEARRNKENETADRLMEEARVLTEEEKDASARTDELFEELTQRLLLIPNIPSDETPDGRDENDNVEIRQWWPGQDDGQPFPTWEPHQCVPHWEIGRETRMLDLEAGAKLAGSMFPLYRGDGSRLLRALGAFALDAHRDAYEEIRPPSFALTETMRSTGHLPKSEDDMYAIERDGLWAIPTAEVPLTSMHRGEILDSDVLPVRLTALTPCFRREAGAAGRDTRGLLRVHEFDKVELFAYCTPEQADDCFNDILARAENLLQQLGLTYRLLSLCAGDIGSSSARTIDLEVFSPGVGRWLEVSSVSWFRDYQSRRAQVRYRDADGKVSLVHTVNGSALAWARIWACVVEVWRQSDGTIAVPPVLQGYLGGDRVIGRH